MPLYEYECEGCAYVQENLVGSMADGTTYVICDVCGATAHRVISGSQLNFKGDGWTQKSFPLQNNN